MIMNVINAKSTPNLPTAAIYITLKWTGALPLYACCLDNTDENPHYKIGQVSILTGKGRSSSLLISSSINAATGQIRSISLKVVSDNVLIGSLQSFAI
jgi:hypothetical protein